MSRCDVIAEALVMGEPLTADDQAHVDGCAACQGLTALPGLLAASASAAPPRPGFSARMMAAARERIGQRRRRRFATFTFALAAAAASAVAADRRFIRHDQPPRQAGDRADDGADDDPAPDELPVSAALESAQIDSYDRAMAPVAPWDDIEQSVRNDNALRRKGGHP